METIVIEHLTIGYRLGRRAVRRVATGLDGTVGTGQLTCLLGANGTGKSTLLRTLAGFQPPLEGHVLIGGRDLRTLSRRQRARQVGVVLTERPDVVNMRVADLVALGRSPYTGFWGNLSAADRQAVDEAMAMVGVGRLSDRSLRMLSDGERQKAMVAKVLAQQTPVMLLDEPTAFLDFGSKVDLLQLLRRLAHSLGKTVMLSTHDVQLALQLADRLWLMHEGGRIDMGTPRELADNGTLAAFIERPDIGFDVKNLVVSVKTAVGER